MKEIVSRLNETRQIELAKSLLESEGYKVTKNVKNSKNLNESYRGLNIAPFREFTREDYYGYAGASKIGDKEPLIFSNGTADILIAGDEDNPSLCGVNVYIWYEDGPNNGPGYYTNPMSFPKALRLGKELVAMADDYEKILYYCEDNMNEY